MEIRWHQIKKKKGKYKLTIEGTVTPKDIYEIVIGHNVDYDHIIITSFDLEKKNFSPLSKEFDEVGIIHKKVDQGLLVEIGWLSCIFENTDFGKSQDSYLLLQTDSNNLTTAQDISVNYEDIPDLEIICQNKTYLEQIMAQLTLKIDSMD